MRIGKCKKCKKELKEDKYHDVYNFPFRVWIKLCDDCYYLKLAEGCIRLYNGVVKSL